MAKDKTNWWDDPEQAEETGGGEMIEPWETGTVFVGTLTRMRKGDYGFLMDVRDESGKLRTFGVPTILSSRLEGVPTGAFVRIECTGSVDTGKGNPAKTFRVHVRKPVKV